MLLTQPHTLPAYDVLTKHKTQLHSKQTSALLAHVRCVHSKQISHFLPHKLAMPANPHPTSILCNQPHALPANNALINLTQHMHGQQTSALLA